MTPHATAVEATQSSSNWFRWTKLAVMLYLLLVAVAW